MESVNMTPESPQSQHNDSPSSIQLSTDLASEQDSRLSGDAASASSPEPRDSADAEVAEVNGSSPSEATSPSKLLKDGMLAPKNTKPAGSENTSEFSSPSKLASGSNIDTASPFASVKAAVSKFGGIVDWKAHKLQAVESRNLTKQELEKVQEEIPAFKKQLEVVEKEKMETIKELDCSKRQIEEMKLNVESLQKEEQQAKQECELAQHRVEELEEEIAKETKVPSKAQLDVAKGRYGAAISELNTVREELESLQKEYYSLVTEKEIAVKKAEEAILESMETEKKVEKLTIELAATKQFTDAVKLEADEQRAERSMTNDQDFHDWEKELKQAEEDLQKLHQEILPVKDLKFKLDTASAELHDLRAKLATHAELELKLDMDEEAQEEEMLKGSEQKTLNELQATVASIKKEVKGVKLNMEEKTAAVTRLKVDATALQSELEGVKTAFVSLKEIEGTTSAVISSLEAELEKTKSEIAQVRTRNEEAKNQMEELQEEIKPAAQELGKAKEGAEQAKAGVAQELGIAKEGAEQAKAGVRDSENSLIAAQKDLKGVKAADNETVDTEESESIRRTNDIDESVQGVMLSVEEYNELNKQVLEADEQANARIAAADSQVESAKESETRTLKSLEDLNRHIDDIREALKLALGKAEKAKAGKLEVEQRLREWRAEHEQRRKATQSAPGLLSPKKNPMSIFEEKMEPENTARLKLMAEPSPHATSLEAAMQERNTTTNPSSDMKMAKKRKKFLPRFLKFLNKKNSCASPTCFV